MENISPKFMTNLVSQVECKLRQWHIRREYDNTEVEDVRKITYYLEKWNIDIQNDDNTNFDLRETLYQSDNEVLLKIAVDLGIETPDFIPSIPVFRNEIKTNYKAASAAFESALKKIESEPNVAISLANSVLESIIKEMLKDERIHTQIKEKNKSLYKLAQQILKVFKIYPDENMPEEIKTIGSSLLSLCRYRRY